MGEDPAVPSPPGRLRAVARPVVRPTRAVARRLRRELSVARSREARAARRAWRQGEGDRRTLAWPHAVAESQSSGSVACNICGWRGAAFGGTPHCESATCPVCGSIARDRFLYWCWTTRTPYDPRAVVLETSPRLDAEYRGRMAARMRYTTSDFDESAHRGAIRLDLERIDLPDASLDVVLTPHVLEHVPDTDKALSELFRVMRPGGHVLLQVPFPQARTAPPTGPEFHGDSTLVHWRFGWDLADTVRRHGFTCAVLVPEELRVRAAARQSFSYGGDDIDVDDLMSGADADAMTVVASADESAQLGFAPAFQFVTLHLRRS